jgi:uncharacterized cupredoxin-like copper-binding protein
MPITQTSRAARQRLRRVAALVAAAAAVPLLAGCGSSSNASSPKTTSAAPKTAVAASSGKLTVTTTEYAFSPMAVTAKAGKLKVTLDNKGKIPHELVVLKTGGAAGSLPVTSGRVSEATSVGEVSETKAGATKSSTLNLKPGSYVFVCNIPGHYADGMRGTLTVQ